MQKWPKKRTQYPLIALIFVVFIVFSILYNESNIQEIHSKQTLTRIPSVPLDKSSASQSTVKYSGKRAKWDSFKPKTDGQREMPEMCDYFSGEWVFDNSSYSLYKDSNCPYMFDQLACHKHGRQDVDYQYWRWQLHTCNLKRTVVHLS